MKAEIFDFMVQDAMYSEMKPEYLIHVISGCVDAGQFLYVPDRYAFLYWLIDASEIEKVLRKQFPESISGGDTLYVTECVCKDIKGMHEAVREFHKIKFKGAFWHRNNEPMIFPQQKGGTQ